VVIDLVDESKDGGLQFGDGANTPRLRRRLVHRWQFFGQPNHQRTGLRKNIHDIWPKKCML
jgi:hypothetical protein